MMLLLQFLRQQQLSPSSTRTDTTTTDSGHRAHSRRYERQGAPSGGSLLRRIDQRERSNQTSRAARPGISPRPEQHQQQGRKTPDRVPLMRSPRDISEYIRQQQRILASRPTRTPTPSQHRHQQQLQQLPVAAPRRLTRIPLDRASVSDRGSARLVEVQRPSSRTRNVIHHRQPLSSNGYPSIRS
ncbi:unnamed protein product [Gongylonema pulchrum]|uniref:Uncharacterized protein n=1 Tax=Gongylonema pulchrum TaxID=637853 RepID=A0A183D3N9_9BILA|nr:unnamed protein product [Gongylonema pulchrum]